MYITNAKPSDEQVEYMEGLGFRLKKSTQDGNKVTWVLPIGDPFEYVNGKDYAITIEVYKDEVPTTEKLLKTIGRKAYKFGWDTKLNQVKEALDIPSSCGFPVDM